MRCTALQKAQFNATNFCICLLLDNISKQCCKAAQLCMAKAIGSRCLCLRNKATIRIVNALGYSNKNLALFFLDFLNI